MNRETFVTLNKTRLFTADQVVDIAESERDKVLDEVIVYLTHEWKNAECLDEPWRVERRDFITRIKRYCQEELRQAGEP